MKSVTGPFVTVAEVAAQVRVSKMTVYRLVKSGELPSIRFGRSYRVTENALTEYIEAQQSEESTSGAA